MEAGAERHKVAVSSQLCQELGESDGYLRAQWPCGAGTSHQEAELQAGLAFRCASLPLSAGMPTVHFADMDKYAQRIYSRRLEAAHHGLAA